MTAMLIIPPPRMIAVQADRLAVRTRPRPLGPRPTAAEWAEGGDGRINP
jgi:hypothetical protein